MKMGRWGINSSSVFYYGLIAISIWLVVTLYVIFNFKSSSQFARRYLGNPDFEGKGVPFEFECPLPKLDPFDPEAMKYMKPPKEANCTGNTPLLFYTDLNSNLIIHGSLGTLGSHGYYDCCYKELFKAAGIHDSKYGFSMTCHAIKSNKTKIPADKEFIGVFCRRNDSYEHKLMDVFAFVHLKGDVEDRSRRLSKIINDKDANYVNIVIFVIDSVSHMNFLRTMPKTRDYVTKNLSAVSLEGHNIVGGNTLPNAMATFSGKNIDDKCVSKRKYYDDCPFIWKNLSALGYRTIYGEDAPRISTFNYAKRGFQKIPTDYYLRPLMLAAENLKSSKQSCVPCSGPRLALEILLDYAKKAAFTFGNKRKYLQLLWTNTLTHQKINGAKLGDESLLETITWLHDKNFLNKTVLILMSDHGMLRGPFPRTPVGKMEHRMPFLYIIFPKWFSQKYPLAVGNLKMNSQRLTSPFDMHKTLLDLSQLQNIENFKIRQRTIELDQKINPRGISLFLETPPNRNCLQAGIPDLLCICYKRELVSKSNVTEKMILAGRAIIESINRKVSPYPQCSSWKFKKILLVQKLLSTGASTNTNSTLSPVAYIISVRAMPAEASFEASVFPNENNWVVSEEILRTNTYGTQSYCVNDRNLKPLCFCSFLLQNY